MLVVARLRNTVDHANDKGVVNYMNPLLVTDPKVPLVVKPHNLDITGFMGFTDFSDFLGFTGLAEILLITFPGPIAAN